MAHKIENLADSGPVVAMATFKSGNKEKGWGRITFDTVDEAIEFEQRFNSVLDMRLHLHFLREGGHDD